MFGFEAFVTIGIAVSGFAASNSILTAPAPEAAGPLLSSAYQPYKLKLTPFFTPPSRPTGLILKARIDGGPQLRLLLDSGAEYLVVDRKAAARSGHAGGEDLDLAGAGKMVRAATRTSAASLDLGELAFRNCPLVIVNGKLAEGIDGVIPLSLFRGFQIRLDAGSRTMNLEPYTEDRPSAKKGFVKALAEHSLLFIAASIEGQRQGYMLLDTGSSYNVISNETARALRRSRTLAPSVAVQAGAGAADGRLLSHGICFQWGGPTMTLDPVVAIDMTGICQRHGREISGMIGHPALASSVLTVDYRDSMVRITSSK